MSWNGIVQELVSALGLRREMDKHEESVGRALCQPSVTAENSFASVAYGSGENNYLNTRAANHETHSAAAAKSMRWKPIRKKTEK